MQNVVSTLPNFVQMLKLFITNPRKEIKMFLDKYEIPMAVEVAAVVIMGIIFGAMFALSI